MKFSKSLKFHTSLMLFAGIIFTTVFLQSCKNKDNEKVIRERIEWSHSWIEPTNKNDLPKVLIIGDSHVERYYGVVKNALKDSAYCSKYTSSLSLGDPYLPKTIALLLEQYHFDLITFNNGLHGRGYTESAYQKYIPIMLDLFKKQKDTRLIWVNTTPVRKRENLDEFADFNRRVIERNKMVTDYMNKNHIPLVDFYTIGAKHADYYSADGVHFNKQGVQAEADMLIKAILKSLK